eukprot:TRINITY_DN5367_c1_g2_i1.p1 TRINITY_DN5367_c1_g2~~TRINITY_DN5367_c1_g2_i1.p1  ORF type:complete len:162 (+),score=39.98 TRINITY_DN5367_c1_g2_i1:79-564(+)
MMRSVAQISCLALGLLTDVQVVSGNLQHCASTDANCSQGQGSGLILLQRERKVSGLEKVEFQSEETLQREQDNSETDKHWAELIVMEAAKPKSWDVKDQEQETLEGGHKSSIQSVKDAKMMQFETEPDLSAKKAEENSNIDKLWAEMIEDEASQPKNWHAH